MTHLPATRSSEGNASDNDSLVSAPVSNASASARMPKTLTGLGPAEMLDNAAERYESAWAGVTFGNEEARFESNLDEEPEEVGGEAMPWKSLLGEVEAVESSEPEEDASAALSEVVRGWAESPQSFRAAALASDAAAKQVPASGDVSKSVELAVNPELLRSVPAAQSDPAVEVQAVSSRSPRSVPPLAITLRSETAPSAPSSESNASRPSATPVPAITAPTSSASLQPVASEQQTLEVSESPAPSPWSATVRSPQAPAGRSSLRTALLAFAGSAVLTALVVPLLWSRGGSLLITAGAAQSPASIDVAVDGELKCQALPCRVDGVRSGAHTLHATARDFQAADRVVKVERGQELQVSLSLAPETNASLHVAVSAPGLHVFVDGEDRGAAPLSLAGLSTGAHSVRLAGSALYAPFEEQVTLHAQSTLNIEPKLVPLKRVVFVTPNASARGAFVEFSAGEQRYATVIDGVTRVELFPAAKYHVRATRRGYRDYESELSFAEDELQRELRVELTPEVDDAVAPAPINSLERGMLSLNSIPISSVLLDGQAVGSTPLQLPMTVGPHNVSFVHPTLGTKSITVQVQAGKTALGTARF